MKGIQTEQNVIEFIWEVTCKDTDRVMALFKKKSLTQANWYEVETHILSLHRFHVANQKCGRAVYCFWGAAFPVCISTQVVALEEVGEVNVGIPVLRFALDLDKIVHNTFD